MKNDAMHLLTQYERYGVLKRKDFVQCFIDEMDIDLSLVSQYNEWLAEQGDAGCKTAPQDCPPFFLCFKLRNL